MRQIVASVIRGEDDDGLRRQYNRPQQPVGGCLVAQLLFLHTEILCDN